MGSGRCRSGSIISGERVSNDGDNGCVQSVQSNRLWIAFPSRAVPLPASGSMLMESRRITPRSKMARLGGMAGDVPPFEALKNRSAMRVHMLATVAVWDVLSNAIFLNGPGGQVCKCSPSSM